MSIHNCISIHEKDVIRTLRMIKLSVLLWPYRKAIAFTLVLVFFQCMGDLFLPTLMADIVNNGISTGDTDYILGTGAVMLLVALGGSACAIGSSFLSSRTAMGFGKNLRSGIFTRVSYFSLAEFDKIGTPSLITRSTNDVVQMQHVIMMIQRALVSAPITAAGGMILALRMDMTLSWIIIAVIPVLGIFIGVVALKGFPLFQSIQKKIDRLNLILRENLTGIRVIRAFDRGTYEKKRFDEANLDLMTVSVKVNRIFAMLMPAMMLVMNLTMVAILAFGSRRIGSGLSNVGNMMAFLSYAMQILFAFLMASMLFIMLPRAQASAERINEVLDLPVDLTDPADPVDAKAQMRGHVEFRHVTFSYPGAETPALRDISFSAKPGETTAIIGSTGSGKSTLVSLIPRFYDTVEGEILVDGVDVRHMTQKNLRSRIGYVPQKTVLFSGTVALNIRYGNEGASDGEMRKAAETAQALEFISTMEKGFDSPVSQGGTNVSGGQKQRLAIARALVGKPGIYLFDDSFSALDFKTDSLLRAALHKETADATVIIVGQRVATIRGADRIIVLDEGAIAGMGTHRELYDSCPVYREIVLSQLTEEEMA